MVKPVCVSCRVFYKPKRNGQAFLEQMPKPGTRLASDPIPRGVTAEAYWQPYKIWIGDLWQCPRCEAEIIVGTAGQPYAEHYQRGFELEARRLGADKIKVNDC